MGCCVPRSAPPRTREETILRVPGATAHLVGDGDAVALGAGELAVVRVESRGAALATVVRVGRGLGWPLAKDEPVVKLGPRNYLFTIPDHGGGEGGGGFLNYGVSFAAGEEGIGERLASLDAFLKENACFSAPSDRAEKNKEVDWKECAPRVEDYNGVLAKAIAGGTGEIVKGIFMCSNAYTAQVQKGADLFRPQAAGASTSVPNEKDRADRNRDANKRGAINKSIKRVRKLSEMTERMSQSLLDAVVTLTGTIGAPLLQSKTGKAFLATVPGEVLLASLDAISK
ncbi:hypothetical protein ACMD2_23888 [Ananas comosus]|uniref:Senescence domain-containing protein n=1 Tax=Ananas comosus TaxID=4615 RepID=A0A199UZT7_ANACO|nr:hypothetical protein ACMD2_23888 [Ananas comosus]